MVNYRRFDVDVLDKSDLVEDPTITFNDNKYRTLEGSICIPSASHSYSLAIEYMRNWFTNKFNKGYFKTVFINGRNVISDYMRYSSISQIKKAKPAVAFTPVPDMEYDNEYVESYMGGRDLYIRKFNHHESFFRDYDNNIFLGLNIRQQKMNFNIRCRVESRAQQLDLYRYMELACRVGYTQFEYISCDFHIPNTIIVNLAKAAGFELDKNDNVVDIIAFTKYLNAHSQIPVIYKLRGASGCYEMFLRANGVYTNISALDKLQYDDGTKEGMLDNDFHVEMNCTLTMWVPAFYVYKSVEPVYKTISLSDDATIGLWTCTVLEVPDTNKDGWNLFAKSDYLLDDDEIGKDIIELDINELIVSDTFNKVVDLHKEIGVSPSKFINIDLFNLDKSSYKIDWENRKINVNNCPYNSIVIAIYIDTEYYNQQLIIMNDMERTRLN